jgi:ribonuclease T2
MKTLRLLSLFALMIPVFAHAQKPGKPGVFDFYLLNLSWAPEYCVKGSGTECTQHLGFVVHGLWPQNNNGSYPESCSKAAGPANPSQYEDLIPDLSLLAHEWAVHGTCSGLGPDAFFGLERQAFHELAIPKLLQNLDHAVQMKPADLTALFQTANPTFPAKSIVVTCSGNELVSVEACLAKSGLKPETCQAVKACTAQTISILPQTGTAGVSKRHRR